MVVGSIRGGVGLVGVEFYVGDVVVAGESESPVREAVDKDKIVNKNNNGDIISHIHLTQKLTSTLPIHLGLSQSQLRHRPTHDQSTQRRRGGQSHGEPVEDGRKKGRKI